MRVLAISSYSGLGGSELDLATLIEHAPPGVDVQALLVADGPLSGRLSASGIDVTVARGFGGRPDARAVARFTRGLGALLRERTPDVVWAQGQKAALLAVLACRRHGVPIVWNKVDFSWDALLAKPLAAAVDGVVAVSYAATEALGPWRRRRLQAVIGAPVALRESLVARPDLERPLLVTLGRLVPYKGHHHILGAAHLLAQNFPTLEVVIAGAPAAEYPDYPERLRILASELGIGERVDFPGFVADVEGLLARTAVYVNATYRDPDGFGLEGLGGAMLQASWAGVPVVAPNEGGIREAVVDGTTGTLVDRAEPHSLAQGIAAYLADPELARRTGEAGRRYARDHFAPAVCARRLYDALAAVAASR